MSDNDFEDVVIKPIPRLNYLVKTGLPSLVKAHLILNCGCDLNETDEFGSSAVLVAAQRNELEMVKILVDAGANINVSNYDLESPLLLAERHHNKDMIDYINTIIEQQKNTNNFKP